MKWVVNTYMDIEGKRERVKTQPFNSYEEAKAYYWEHKTEERSKGRYLELKCYKA